MKKHYKNSFCLFALLQIILSAGNASAQERDPFSPTGSGMMNRVKELVGGTEQAAPQVQNFSAADPLTSTQLSGYKVTGTIISDTQKVAAVRAINNVSYILKVGDNLGSEGGKISNITLAGITVQTESQEIKMPVSNTVEVPLENTNKK